MYQWTAGRIKPRHNSTDSVPQNYRGARSAVTVASCHLNLPPKCAGFHCWLGIIQVTNMQVLLTPCYLPQEGLALVAACHHQRVPEWVKLVASVVHDASEVAEHLGGVNHMAVVLLVVASPEGMGKAGQEGEGQRRAQRDGSGRDGNGSGTLPCSSSTSRTIGGTGAVRCDFHQLLPRGSI